jgi:hypothetical protein
MPLVWVPAWRGDDATARSHSSLAKAAPAGQKLAGKGKRQRSAT